MNPIFRSLEDLTLNINDFESRVRFYQDNVYDNVYFVDRTTGEFYGYQNFANECLEHNSKISYHIQEDIVSNENITQWFAANPSLYRLPVVKGNVLIGEYYDADSFGMLLYRNIEKHALSVMNAFSWQITKYIEGKRVRVLGEDSTLNPSWIVPVHETDQYDILLDLDYSPFIRKVLAIDDPLRVSPSQIIIPFLISELSSYFQKRGIRWIAYDGIMHSELRMTNPRKYKVGNSIEEALSDNVLLEKFCRGDKGQLGFLMSHKNNLNRISKVFYNGIHNELIDYASDGFNILDGKRTTIGSPIHPSQTIHIFGPCIVEGLCVTDDKTIASILQKELATLGYSNVKVNNYGLAYGKDILNDLIYMASTNVKSGDLILWITGFTPEEEQILTTNKIPVVDCKFLANTTDEFWYLDNPFHCNYWMNKRFAEIILKSLMKDLDTMKGSGLSSNYINDNNIPLKTDKESILNSEELHKYVNKLKSHRFTERKDRIGCVVINANPYTLGHRHLIQSALKDVNLLYVIIVEENTGEFIYNERYEMVNSEWANFPMVKIISGGNVLTSSLGFPEYFHRSKQLKNANPLLNHKIFSRYVAPALGINVRFFGEETNDVVTRSLNETALSYLPQNGIEAKIIKRKEISQCPISAKTVRSLYDKNDFLGIIPLVPFATYRFLLNRYYSGKYGNTQLMEYFKKNMDPLVEPIKRNGFNYPGMFYKFGISINGENYMLKISQTSNDRLNLFSELIGSKLCKILEIPCSQIRLTLYNSKLALLSKSWDLDSGQFFPLSSFYEEKIDEQDTPVEYLYNTFIEIVHDKCPQDFDDILSIFWRLFIIDYLLCNARGAGNIGFIFSDKIRLAPVYDNSTSLTNLGDKSYMAEDFPKLPMKFGEEFKSSYDVLKLFKDTHLENALYFFKRKLRLEDLLDFITSEEEEYLIEVIKFRYKKLFSYD